MESFRISKLKPYIAENGHPYLSLAANGYDGDLMVDTGFSEGLSLPESLEPQFKNNLHTPTRFTLADGTILELKVYLVKLSLKRQNLGYCSVIFIEREEGLVGIDFFRLLQKEFCINWQSNRFELR